MHALKQLLILHADHEQNCSTSTVRLVGSSDANIYASIAAGIDALWGPLHGGANQAAIEMLEDIRDNGGDVATRSSTAPRTRTTTSASRASATASTRTTTRGPASCKATAERVLADLGSKDSLFDIALELEQVALTDDYFIEQKLYPNVDFYSGLIYRAMGFPTNMFPVLFAIGRLPGLDRALEGSAREPAHQDRAPAPDLHGAAPSASTWRSKSANSRRRSLPRRGRGIRSIAR